MIYQSIFRWVLILGIPVFIFWLSSRFVKNNFFKATVQISAVSLAFLFVFDAVLGLVYTKYRIGVEHKFNVLIRKIESDKAGYFKNVTIGDSIFEQVDYFYTLILPGGKEELMPLSSNYSATIMGYYFLYHRYLQNHKAPQNLVIGYNFQHLAANYYSFPRGTESAVFQTFTQWKEIADIYKSTNDASILRRMLSYKFFFTPYVIVKIAEDFKNLMAPTKPLDSVHLPTHLPPVPPPDPPPAITSPLFDIDANFLEKFKSNIHKCSGEIVDTYVDNSAEEIRQIAKDLARYPDLKIDKSIVFANFNFCMTKTADSYLRRLIVDAASSNTNVIYTPTPMYESRFALVVKTGVKARADRYFFGLARQYKNFYYVNDLSAYYPDGYFISDHVHMNPNAVQDYFRKLGNLFNAPTMPKVTEP